MNLTDYMTLMISLSMVKRLDHESSLNPIAVIAKQYATFKLSKKKKNEVEVEATNLHFFLLAERKLQICLLSFISGQFYSSFFHIPCRRFPRSIYQKLCQR